jgi:thiol:disulfide interchange protein DsbD
MEGKLHWRKPSPPAASITGSVISGGIEWQHWSPAALEKARATKRPILVDFTAKWCLTCQINKKTSIAIDSVREKIKTLNVITMIENSPVKSPEVIAELNRHGRAGVPLVLVYPKDPAKPPVILPEILTPSIVLKALDDAAK